MPHTELNFSIIIPTYNRKKEIKRCVEEVYKQKYSESKYEVIVVDDGSNDGTEDTLRQFRDRFSSFQYYIRSNEGPGKARNYASAKAKGKILVFIDSDCVMPSDFLIQPYHHNQT